jgi:hypothetical protein
MNGTGPHVPHAREKVKLSRCTFDKEHEAFHSRGKGRRADKPARFRELLRGVGEMGRGNAVVLVLKFLLYPGRFVSLRRTGFSLLDFAMLSENPQAEACTT